MTQKDKQLLIKDLSARLPCSVWGLHRGEDLPLYVIDDSGAYMVLGYNAWFDLEIVPFKPYLRPMSSMTEEEKEEYCDLQDKFLCSSQYPVTDAYELFDWLNAHHFDYRGLIEKGLAIEAPEEMYKID